MRMIGERCRWISLSEVATNRYRPVCVYDGLPWELKIKD